MDLPILLIVQLIPNKFPMQGHRKDFWSGPAVIGAHKWHAVCNGAHAQISIMNFIKLPKKWIGSNAYAMYCVITY